LLLAWRGGDEAALSRLIPALERGLHRIAQGCMAGERSGHTQSHGLQSLTSGEAR
jgi:hypothetical protein